MTGIEQDVSWWVKELAVIAASPVAAISYAVVVALSIWAILDFVYRERIETLKEQINLAKAGSATGPDKKKAERRQAAIDVLSRDLSEAIHNLLNRPHDKQIDRDFVTKWSRDFHEWCSVVSKRLEDREFFTESDQLHFDRLGVVPITMLSGNPEYDRLVSMLNLKFERLRDLIERVPQRPL